MFDAARVPPRPEDERLWPVTLEGATVEAGGRRLLDRLSLRLDPGGTTALMGPNGAGKSLTLRLLAGLAAPASGAVRWGGMSAPPPGRVGLVFQRPVLLRRSAAGNLRHALKLAGVRRGDRAERVADLLDRAGLADRAHAPARALSGGEQQRLALVRALAFRPALLLLDEPTASLDPRATAAFEAMLRRTVAEGATVLIVTHDAGQARRLADRALLLHEGRLAEDAPAAEFFAAPRSAEARAYLEGRLLL